jgi:hypothetical protein
MAQVFNHQSMQIFDAINQLICDVIRWVHVLTTSIDEA